MKKFLIRNNSKEQLEGLIKFIERVTDKDQAYIVEVKKQRKLRTLKQNNYYWLVITYAACHIGDYKEDVHHMFARKFIPKKITIPGTGRKKIIGGSTQSLDTYEFTIYIKQIKAYMAREYRIAIPEPHKVTEFEMARVQQEYDLMIAA